MASTDTSTKLTKPKKDTSTWVQMLAGSAFYGCQQLSKTGGDPMTGASFEHIRRNLAFDSACSELRKLGDMADNWDGYGALKVGADALSNGSALLDVLCLQNSRLSPPEIAPNSNGTLSFEWQRDNFEAYLEIGNTKASGYCKYSNQPTTYIYGPPDHVNVWLPLLLTAMLDFDKPRAPTMTSVGYPSDMHGDGSNTD